MKYSYVVPVVILFVLLAFIFFPSQNSRILTISTTTSLYDTGLLDVIAEEFMKDSGIEIHFIPKGTGAAIIDAKQGVSDGLLVHSPVLEKDFLEEMGYNRKVFAYNYFVIVGSDKKIEASSATEFLMKVAEYGRQGKVVWVSRDDKSGTNTKEKELWKMAGLNYSEIKNEAWFRSTGTGMGKTLLYTNNIGKSLPAYTLSDIGTFLKFKKDGLIELEIYVNKGEELINIYSMMGVRGKKEELFMEFEKWMMDRGQKIIAEFGDYSQPLFYPISMADEKTLMWIAKYGFFEDNRKLTECPLEFRKGSMGFIEVESYAD